MKRKGNGVIAGWCWFMAACVVGIFVLSSSSLGIASQNLVQNGDFEKGLDGWRLYRAVGTTELSCSETQVHSGKRAACLDSSEPNWRASVYQDCPAQAEKTYTLEFWARVEGEIVSVVKDPVYAVIWFGDENRKLLTRQSISIDPLAARENWVHSRAIVRSPGGTAKVIVEFYLWGRGKLYVDDVIVAEEGAGSLNLSADRTPELVERKPLASEWGFRPDDGEAVAVNPPPLSWVPVAGASSYVVELSEDESFRDGKVIRAAGIVLPHYVHNEPLKAGRWFWRYRFVDSVGQESTPSKVRSFMIPANASILPLPHVDVLIERLAVGHPRIYFNPQSLDAFKRSLEASGRSGILSFIVSQQAAGPLYQSLVPEPDPYPGGGRPDFSRGDHAAHLAKITSATQQVAGAISRLAYAYMVTGDERYGKRAKEWLMHLASWDPHGITSWAYDDYATMYAAKGLARGYDWLYGLLTEEERARVREALKVRASEIYRFLRSIQYESRPFHNHGTRSLAFLGDAALALAGEVPEAREWLNYVVTLMVAVYPSWGGKDGGWNEGINYGKWYMITGLDFAYTLRCALGVDLFQKPWFQNAGYFRIYASPIGSVTTPFGDGGTSGRHDNYDKAILNFLATMFDDPILKAYRELLPGDSYQAAVGVSAGDFLGFPATDSPWFAMERLDESSDPAELLRGIPQSRAFYDVGWAALNTDLAGENNVRFLFRSSPYGNQSHSHAGQNTFALEAYGEVLALDSGYYPWYGSRHHNRWTQQTRSKNGILVDGQGQPWPDPGAKGKLAEFFTSRAVDFVRGDGSLAYPGKLTAFDRDVIFAKPDYIVLIDRLKASRPSEMSWLLHSPHPMEIDEAAQRVHLAGEKAGLEVWMLDPKGALRWEVTDRYSSSSGPGKVWAGEDVPPESKDGGVEPWPRSWHLAITSQAREEGFFLAVLRPYRKGDVQKGKGETSSSEPKSGTGDPEGWDFSSRDLGNGGVAVVARGPGMRDLLITRSGIPGAAGVSPIPLESEGFTVNGAYGWVRCLTDAGTSAGIPLGPGNITSALLVDGQSLEYNGHILIRSSASVTASLEVARVEASKDGDRWEVRAAIQSSKAGSRITIAVPGRPSEVCVRQGTGDAAVNRALACEYDESRGTVSVHLDGGRMEISVLGG